MSSSSRDMLNAKTNSSSNKQSVQQQQNTKPSISRTSKRASDQSNNQSNHLLSSQTSAKKPRVTYMQTISEKDQAMVEQTEDLRSESSDQPLVHASDEQEFMSPVDKAQHFYGSQLQQLLINQVCEEWHNTSHVGNTYVVLLLEQFQGFDPTANFFVIKPLEEKRSRVYQVDATKIKKALRENRITSIDKPDDEPTNISNDQSVVHQPLQSHQRGINQGLKGAPSTSSTSSQPNDRPNGEANEFKQQAAHSLSNDKLQQCYNHLKDTMEDMLSGIVDTWQSIDDVPENISFAALSQSHNQVQARGIEVDMVNLSINDEVQLRAEDIQNAFHPTARNQSKKKIKPSSNSATKVKSQSLQRKPNTILHKDINVIKANVNDFRDLLRAVLDESVETIKEKGFDDDATIESFLVKDQIVDTFNNIKQLKFDDDDDLDLNLARAKNLCGQLNKSIDAQPLLAMCNHVAIAIMTWDMKQANKRCYESRALAAGVKIPSNYINLYSCFRDHFPDGLENLNNLIRCPLAHMAINVSELWIYMRGDVYKEITSPVLAEYFKD